VHKLKNIATSVHGDDFTSVGPKIELDWLEAKLESRYELRKGGRLGPGENDAKDILVLNRAIRWTESGLEYEADPRQAERLLEGLGLDEDCKSTATPGIKPLVDQLVEDTSLPTSAYTGFRGQAARANYLAADRINLQFAAKEVCRLRGRANGDVRGRHEAPGALPNRAQTSCVDVPIPESRGHRRLQRHGLVWLSEDAKVDQWRLRNDREPLHPHVELDTALRDSVLR
jgi:hypothetical protein